MLLNLRIVHLQSLLEQIGVLPADFNGFYVTSMHGLCPVIELLKRLLWLLLNTFARKQLAVERLRLLLVSFCVALPLFAH